MFVSVGLALLHVLFYSFLSILLIFDDFTHVSIVLCLDYIDPVALFSSFPCSLGSLSSSPIVPLHF